MTDLQLNPPKKERVWIIPFTMQKYHMGKSELMELGRGYEEQAGDIEAQMAQNTKSGMTAMNACLQEKLSGINFQIKMIESLLAQSAK